MPDIAFADLTLGQTSAQLIMLWHETSGPHGLKF